MSSRRSRPRQALSSPAVTDGDEQVIIKDLVMKLRAILPARSHHRIPAHAAGDRVSAAKVLQETCDYIRTLQQEVGDLSERLSELLSAGDHGAAAADEEAAIIMRSLLM